MAKSVNASYPATTEDLWRKLKKPGSINLDASTLVPSHAEVLVDSYGVAQIKDQSRPSRIHYLKGRRDVSGLSPDVLEVWNVVRSSLRKQRQLSECQSRLESSAVAARSGDIAICVVGAGKPTKFSLGRIPSRLGLPVCGFGRLQTPTGLAAIKIEIWPKLQSVEQPSPSVQTSPVMLRERGADFPENIMGDSQTTLAILAGDLTDKQHLATVLDQVKAIQRSRSAALQGRFLPSLFVIGYGAESSAEYPVPTKDVQLVRRQILDQCAVFYERRRELETPAQVERHLAEHLGKHKITIDVEVLKKVASQPFGQAHAPDPYFASTFLSQD